MAEGLTADEMELLRELVVEVRDMKARLGALASVQASASEDIISRIKRLQDEEHKAACLILARVERMDSALAGINERLALAERVEELERRPN